MNETSPILEVRVIDRMVRVRGTVQGVGFRPFVQRTATQLGLCGWVRNDSDGVLARVAGDQVAVMAFVRALAEDAPPAARVMAVETTVEIDDSPVGDAFAIVTSEAVAGGPVATAVPADLAICPDCRREMLDPANRRHRYPFINCTQCGPRYSLIVSLPYDRPRTTMQAFQMCPACAHEYRDPNDRRFHAQPIACPECGPQVYLAGPNGAEIATRAAALVRAKVALCAGRIIAVKGVGGFHLMCDAGNETAVALLRERKHREEKPLAVMFRSLDALRLAATISPEAAALLESPAAPVVLVPRLPLAAIAPSVAPGNPWLGALLPYSPLHVLLLAACDRPLVATSANLSEEPLCTNDADARERLAGIADFFLGHDRPIARPVDDSVVRLSERAEPILLRRARGYAPAPLRLPGTLPAPILCVGAQMKSTVAAAAGDRVVLSPHIGDLGNAATVQAFEHTIDTFGELHGSRFSAVVHDKHPDYASTRHALASGLPTIAVQHHLAHVLACLLEHDHPADKVLGVAWDGTGYGEDGTVWGGEFILLERGVATRFARLRRFRLPGGEAAVRDPRRVALALTHELGDAQLYWELARRFGFSDADAVTLRAMLAGGINSPLCSSAGRLFDAVGALLGLGTRNAFEGQMPLAVEAAAWRARATTDSSPFELQPAVGGGAVWSIDWAPLVLSMLRPCTEVAAQAAAFHRGLARMIADVARAAGVGTVALTGGCFQNALLHDLAGDSLRADGLRVLTHRELSPNDGSIAAGQALGALWNLTNVLLP